MAFDPAEEQRAANEAYNVNASYDEEVSVEKAKAFRTACRKLIGLMPSSAAQGGESYAKELIRYENAITEVNRWLSINDTASTTVNRGGVIYPDFTNFRN